MYYKKSIYENKKKMCICDLQNVFKKKKRKKNLRKFINIQILPINTKVKKNFHELS